MRSSQAELSRRAIFGPLHTLMTPIVPETPLRRDRLRHVIPGKGPMVSAAAASILLLRFGGADGLRCSCRRFGPILAHVMGVKKRIGADAARTVGLPKC